MPAVHPHPPDHVLSGFLLGKLPDPDHSAVEEHVVGCEVCQSRAAAAAPAGDTLTELLAAARTTPDAARAAATPDPSALATPSFAPTSPWDGPAPVPPPEAPPGLADHPRYRLVRPLGHGGMGTVWLAEHAVMGRPVALKVIRPEFLSRPGAADRFRREVKAAARLNHPNIVTAYDADQAGETHFLVMEYVEGRTLAALLKGGPVPPAGACRYVRDAARGLAHAHAAGLTHRDVKPQNLMLAADGTVKVLDFGLVTVSETGTGLTGANMVVGTPDYIAPEQAEDPRAADPRSDVYSLGCTLYHLLAGHVPFPADPTLKKLDAHRAADPKPLDGVPPGLAAVVRKMMAKDPAARYQSADEAAAALEPFCDPAARPAAARRRRRVLVAVGLLALAAGIVVLAASEGWVIVRDKDGKEFARVRIPDGGDAVVQPGPVDPAKVIPVVPAERVGLLHTFPAGTGGSFPEVLSPDGRRIALPVEDREAWNVTTLRVVDTATGRLVRELRAPGRRFTYAAFLPGGAKLLTAELTRSEAYRFLEWDLDDGACRPLPQLGDPGAWPCFFDVSADGRRLAYTASAREDMALVRVVDLASGKVLVEVKKDGAKRMWAYARLSADGSRAVTTVTVPGAVTGQLRLHDLDTGKTVLTADVSLVPGQPGFPLLLADGTPAWASASFEEGGRLTRWDVAAGKPTGQTPLPGQVHLITLHPGRIGCVTLDGPDAYRIRVVDTVTGRTVFDVKPDGRYQNFTLSADGRVLSVRAGDEVRLYRLPRPDPAP